ncbi:hypothetical protein QCN29_12775 [Streptomyces sp. HNM0663]|uniref:Integral membrane protein n=1 Tax=Streptomyces chengmaiensis TaxID=3040919 RepID=A0ABT6HLN7_9ACTN|nr:hypothetical protein [Streptomyces chengmaiensis]MDH2389651.1 hypothetical protein [Streptomyces chengmaiensis]
MGIESDKLVYDYLSRVGDLAQQHQLPSGDRMRLVASLREEIDRRRSGVGGNSPAAVRRILGRIGTPDEVVASAATGSPSRGTRGTPAAGSTSSGASASAAGPAPPHEPGSGPVTDGLAPPWAALPEQRARRRVPRPRKSSAPPPAAPPAAASPPHLAGMDELGPSGSEPDWWRIEPGPFGPGDAVSGFVGGVEEPELLRPPPSRGEEGTAEETAGKAAAAEGAEEAADADAAPARRRLLSGLRLSSPLLLLAAALLAVGAVSGSWLALGLGWLFAYGSRTLTRTQAKWAVLGLPGAVAAGAVVWLWGRLDGRWGEPIPEDGMREALTDAWPWVVRGAAVASALFLVWRARRR